MKEFRRIPIDERTDKDDDRFHFHYTRVRLNTLETPKVFVKRKRLIERELILRNQLKTVSTEFFADRHINNTVLLMTYITFENRLMPSLISTLKMISIQRKYFLLKGINSWT